MCSFSYYNNLTIIRFLISHLSTASKTTNPPNETKMPNTIMIEVQNAIILPPPMHFEKNTQ